ncbi:MAG: GIY-YIG nuclease family protein [Candidatus Omnitrophica bacterium]|nr:GIY-YIG nuclease family protein [Candidatus Omnitrophota bacterium]
MWYVYLLRCADGSLYSGSTTDLTKRLKRHLSGRGGKYTRAKKAVALEYAENFNARRDALKREIEIKKLNHLNKEKLIRFGNGKRYVSLGIEKN